MQVKNPKTGLTKRQEAFCQAFVRLGDKSAAYREAYGASKMKNETVNRKAVYTYKLDNVRTRIEQLQDKRAEIAEKKFGITNEEMLRHLNILRNARIDEYVEYERGNLKFKDFSKLTKEQLMCIESIKQNRYGEIELKLHGKDWTIEKINKHIGFYEKDNKQKSNDISINNTNVAYDLSKVSESALEELEKAIVKKDENQQPS